MSQLFFRTSVTVDEAVAIMLGWVKGPIEYRAVSEDYSPEELESLDIPDFCLNESLFEDQEQLKSDLAEARDNNMPAEVIAEKQAAIQAHLVETDQAMAYLSAIQDEINKGERSTLHVDTKLSNGLQTYITLSSLDNWAEQYGRRFLAKLPKASDNPLPPNVLTKPKQRTKMRDQEAAILEKIREFGYDPKKLPRNEPGKAGVKASVRDKLNTSPLFEAKTAFETAWERLSKGKEIITI